MKRYLIYLLSLTALTASLSSCRTAAPRVDYKALAKAAVVLGVDIDLNDKHQLYIEAAEWLGAPYRAGGDSKRGTDCSGFTRHIYRKVYHIKLERSTDKQMTQSSSVSRRNLREGDLVFFSSNYSKKKVAHAGIYLKNGKFVHASTSRGVIVSSLSEKYYTTHWMKGGRVGK